MSSELSEEGTGDALGSRRRFLALAAAAVVGVAGCSTGTADRTPTDAGAGGGGSDTDRADGGTGSPGGTAGGSGDLVGQPLAAWSAYDPEWEPPTTSPLASDYEVEVLVENLEIPWDVAFAPDGTVFLTERVGRVLRFQDGEVRPVATPEGAIDAGSIEPGSDENSWLLKGGEGGTLGIAVHPAFPDPSLVYIYYTHKGEDGTYNKVDAFDVESDNPGTPVRTVVDTIPADTYHNGGRIAFGPRNYLWVTCGDALDGTRAQDLSSLGGKFLRVTPEGDPAPGNPDYDDGDRRVFSYGHRNPQGIVWLPDGTPVGIEHGPHGRDEFNRLEPGANYGWDGEDERIRNRDQYPDAGVHKPLYSTGSNSFAPTGSVFYTGDAVPELRNRMLTGGLISQQVVATTLTPSGGDLPPAEDAYEQVTDAEWSDPDYAATVHGLLRNELGRIRTVAQGPDGNIYACTSNRDGRAKEGFPREIDDVLVRIRPA
jgi:glucose/arabinose dehydrogenase